MPEAELVRDREDELGVACPDPTTQPFKPWSDYAQYAGQWAPSPENVDARRCPAAPTSGTVQIDDVFLDPWKIG